MSLDRFWKKSYDQGLTDLDPSSWDNTYVDAVRETFQSLPDKMAMEFMGVEINYRDLDVYSNKFADMLIKQGFKEGDVIGLNMANIPQYVIAILGVLRAGCTITGVSPLYSQEQMEYQLKDCGAKGLVTLDAIFAGRVVNIADNLPDLKLIVTASIGDFLPKIKAFLGKLIGKIPKGKVTPIRGKSVLNFMDIINNEIYSSDFPQNIRIDPESLAFILYTGGTTGPPKGAMLTHKNIISDLLIVQKWLSWEKGKGIALSGFPFFHVAGIFFCLNVIYLGWSQLLIADPRDSDHICSCIKKYRPSVMANVPSLYQILLKNPKFKELDHSSLNFCISAAAPFPKESQKEFESVVGKGKLLEVYGMTETSPLTTMNPAKGEKRLGSIGLPLLNTEIKLINTDTGEDAKIGEPGEIVVKGPQVMKGYWNKPEETKNAIDENNFMHTGDVGVFSEDGYLKIVDRTKDMIIVGGYKVFSSKLEDVMSMHPAIDLIASVGVPNPDRPGSEIVMTYITPPLDYIIEDEDSLKKEIISWVKNKVAPYEVPKIIEFRKELPLTVVGKVDKKDLRKEARAKYGKK
ncbi:MAG: AMP-binding protein [Promethearchaeota archaeon]